MGAIGASIEKLTRGFDCRPTGLGALAGQAYTQIIFFEDERAFREFSEGGFEFGGKVNATVIKASAHATASTAGSTAGASGGLDDVENVSPGYYKGMAVFIIATGGLMFEASVGGQRFSYQPIEQGLPAEPLAGRE